MAFNAFSEGLYTCIADDVAEMFYGMEYFTNVGHLPH